jgi:hypothetical protein
MPTRKRCPNGTRRNKKTGDCEKIQKKSSFHATKKRVLKSSECKFGPYRFTKKQAITVRQLKNDSYQPILTESDVRELIVDINLNADERRKITDSLLALRLNYRFPHEFSDSISESLWELSCKYNKDIPKIKDHLLMNQATDSIVQFNKGYIEISDINCEVLRTRSGRSTRKLQRT